MKTTSAIKYINKGITPCILERAIKLRTMKKLAEEKDVSTDTLTTLKQRWGLGEKTDDFVT